MVRLRHPAELGTLLILVGTCVLYASYLAAGWVLLCLYTVHPLLLPRPGPSPRPHGPFRRAVDAKGDVSSVLLLVNPGVRNLAVLTKVVHRCASICEVQVTAQKVRYHHFSPRDKFT